MSVDKSGWIPHELNHTVAPLKALPDILPAPTPAAPPTPCGTPFDSTSHYTLSIAWILYIRSHEPHHAQLVSSSLYLYLELGGKFRCFNWTAEILIILHELYNMLQNEWMIWNLNNFFGIKIIIL